MTFDADWKFRYARKIATAEEAVRAILPGRRILISSGAGEPGRLVEALVSHATQLRGNEIVHLMTLGAAPYVAPGLEERFRHMAFFIGSNVRSAVQEGRADFLPVFLSEIPQLITSGRLGVHAALIQVSLPDQHGFVSLGVSVDIVRGAVDTADIILAEVNPQMPRTLGDSFLHVDRIAHLIPVDDPLPELKPEPLDDVCRQIGHHAAQLIHDGATLQMGIGRIPDAVMSGLKERSDLGIHTEMLSDGVMALAKAGVITGRKKTLLPGKIVTSFIMGTRALYDWVDDNPAVEMTGQVAADSIGGRFFSGIGGQVDFIRGAARSKGGKPIIALPSTAKSGQISRIVPVLEEGAGVVTSRGDIHYVVTEYGTADLWGKNIRQRTEALIGIAHPDLSLIHISEPTRPY